MNGNIRLGCWYASLFLWSDCFSLYISPCHDLLRNLKTKSSFDFFLFLQEINYVKSFWKSCFFLCVWILYLYFLSTPYFELHYLFIFSSCVIKVYFYFLLFSSSLSLEIWDWRMKIALLFFQLVCFLHLLLWRLGLCPG